MKSQTKTTLQKLVFEVMNPENGPVNEEEISDWITQIPNITADVIDTLRLIVFANIGNKLICRYYRQIQIECTNSLDRLDQYPKFAEPMLLLYQHVLHCLEEIMEYMQYNCQYYLDPKIKMPIAQYKKAAIEIESGIDVMVAGMMKCNVDKTLQALVVGRMAGLLKQGAGSYNQIEYLETLQSSIVELCKTDVYVNNTSQLCRLLLRMNFNTAGFIAYNIAEFDREMAEIYEVQEKYHFLYEQEKQFDRLRYKHRDMEFEPAMDGLRYLMLKYVRTELAYLNRQHKRCSAPVMPVADIRQGVETEIYKVKVSFSVDALAYFFKLLIKAGAVEEGSKSKLLLLLAKHFQTPGIGNGTISINSINTKYKQVVQTTAKGVRALLVRMLKLLDDEFNLV